VRSARVVALDHTTVPALRTHRERQQEAAAYSPGFRASRFVFTNLNGDPMASDRAHPAVPQTRRAGKAASSPAA
jgi:hypothetical protein